MNVTAEQQYERDVWLFSTSSSWVSYDDEERSRWKSVRGLFLSPCPSKTKLNWHAQYERYAFASLSQVFDNHICRNGVYVQYIFLLLKGYQPIYQYHNCFTSVYQYPTQKWILSTTLKRFKFTTVSPINSQHILTFEKLKLENFSHFHLKNIFVSINLLFQR